MSNPSFVKLHEQQIPETGTIDVSKEHCPSCSSEDVFAVSKIYDRDSFQCQHQMFCCACGYDWMES